MWRPNRRKKRRLICLCLSFFLPPPSPQSPVSLVVSVSCRCCLRKFSTHAGGKVTQFVSVPPTDGPYDAVTAKELCNCRLLFLSARTHGCRLITVLFNVQLFFNPVQTSLLSCLGAKTVASTATLREGCLVGSFTSQTARKNVDVNCLNLTATMCPPYRRFALDLQFVVHLPSRSAFGSGPNWPLPRIRTRLFRGFDVTMHRSGN